MAAPHHPPHAHPFLARVALRLLGSAAVILLAAFSLWLVKLLYYDHTWREEMMRRYQGQERERLEAEAVARQVEHAFHMEIPYSLDTMSGPPICFACHTPYPHRENERTRSYLNMHGAFLACESCHSRPPGEEIAEHRWVSDATDTVAGVVFGQRGVYGAHVYPVRRSESGELARLGKRTSQQRWRIFVQRLEDATEEEREEMEERAHEERSGEPIDCSECHEPGGVMDFVALGYSEQRSEHLAHVEVVAMIEASAEFHLPDLRGITTAVNASP